MEKKLVEKMVVHSAEYLGSPKVGTMGQQWAHQWDMPMVGPTEK